MKAYIVVGETGEYSDHFEWVVAAFTEKSRADELCGLLQNETAGSCGWEYEKRYAFRTPLDRRCRIDYTGVFYEVREVNLNPEVPTND